MYSTQELRELAVRGISAPGMHVLDFVPDTFRHLPGIDPLVQSRRAEVAQWTGGTIPTAPAEITPPGAQDMTRVTGENVDLGRIGAAATEGPDRVVV